MLIASTYSAMFINIRNTRKASAQPNSEANFAIRFFFIVLTDACCWIPIIILKLLAFCGISADSGYFSFLQLSREIRIINLSLFFFKEMVYGWLSILILPINSLINPLLYSLSTPIFLRRAGDVSRYHWRRIAPKSMNCKLVY